MTSAKLLLESVRVVMRENGIPDVPTVAPFHVGGAVVHLRTLSAERLTAILLWRKANPRDDTGLCAHILAAAVCDPEGRLLYKLDEVRHRLRGDIAEALTAEVLRRHGMIGG